MIVTADAVNDRITYGSEWKNLSATEEDDIFEQVILQADTKWCKDNIHSMIAEWINENYCLYLEMEKYSPDQEILELENVEVEVKTTLYGHSVYLDVPHDRQTVAKKSYIGTPDLGYAINDTVEDFAVDYHLFTRGVLDEVRADGEINPNRLRGLDEYIYEKLGGNYARRYLGMLEDQLSGLVKVERG